MRRVIGASRWSFIVAAGSDVGCSLLLSSTPSTVIISTTTTTVIALATQRAHRHERRPQQRRHTDWRRTAPLSKSNNNNNNNDTSVRGPLPRRQRAECGERRQRGEGEVSAENRLNVNITAKGTGRFSRRHGAPKENSSERHFSQGITAAASAAEKHSHNMAAASASASRGELGAFKRLLKVHMAMRNNYESLQQNQQVVVSFSRVCAEALLQLDLPLRRAERVEEKGKDDDDKQKRYKKKRGEKEKMKKKKKGEKSTEIVVKICDKSPSNDNDVTMLPLLLPLDSPLYMVPISFPPPPVESLLNISASSKPSLDKDGRNPLLMNVMEVDDITSTEGSALNSDKCNNNNNNNNNNNHARDTDSGAAWGTMTPGLEGLFASFQDIPITDIVRLMDTVAYFKWVKDEDLLEWQKGSLLERLRSQVSASHAATLKAQEMMSSPNLADDGVKEARQAVELTRKNLLDRLPCVDCVGVLEQTSSSSSSSSAKPCVHVIDAMLNVLMRVCLWRWPSLSCVDQTSVVLLCTFPWFARDMSVEAVSWMTHDYLRRILARDSSINYFQSLVYVQRVRRLCWPSVYDSDSSFVRNIFLIDESSSCTVKDGDRLRSNTKEEEGVHEKEEKQPQEHQQQCEEAEVTEKNASAARSSLRDVACILCGSPEKQRAAYECLFIWLKQVNASDLHHNSPHGRYVSAIGIAVADVDRFVTERFSTELKEGNFVLLRALQKNTAALEHMTEGLGTPFALSRLFFCRYHKVLPYIWFKISARRRYLLWTAWCCSVARHLVDFVLTPSVGDMKDEGKEKGVDEEKRERGKCTIPFLESLITSITPDVSFQRLMTRIVILSLNEMSAPGNTQPLEEVCTHLIEVVYTGALVLHCNTINSPEVATNVETKFTVTTNIDKMDGKSPEEEEQHQHQQEQQSSAIIAIRRAFNKAISALIQRLNAEHIPLVRRLLDALFELDTARAKGETPFRHDIRKGVSCICDNEFQTLLGEWLNRRMLLRSTKTTPLSDPLLRRWQQAAEEADAGLPTALPSLMECYRGLLGLLRRRGHELINVEQQQKRKMKNENKKEKKEEEHCVEDSTTHATNTNAPSGSSSSSTPVFSLSELQVILTVLSRLVLARTSTLRSLKVGSLSHEFATLLATSMNVTEGGERSASADNKNDNNFMEKKNDQGSTTDASDTTTSTTTRATISECVMLLDRLLSSEVISRACELPWNSLLEAILLQLAPYTILETTDHGISSNGETVTAKHSARAQKFGEEIELHHHQRLVAKHVLLKCFSFAVPCDGGWAGVSQMNRSKSEKELTTFTGDISQVHGITWMLINSVVKTVAKDLRKKMRGLRKVKQKQEEPEEKTKKDATKDIATTEQVESVLDCHALTAYMHLAPLFSTCSLSSCEAYEEFLHSVEVVVVHFAGNHNHHYLWSDCLFLWLAANATVIGVHFSPAQTYTWSPVGGLASLQSSDKEPSGSLEEKTMRLLHILVPYVQSEILRTSNPRLKFLVNTIVAIQAFGRLGINMDPAALNVDQLLLRASTDRRLLYRHLNLFLVGCSALPSTRHALLNTAAFLREARNVLSPAEMDRALVAISLSADAFAKSHEIQADLQQNGSPHDVGHITAPTIRVTPTQLRHAWSALGRRILERTGEMPTSVFVKSLQCAGAVACVDTLVCKQLLSFLMEFRSGELSLLDWTVILRTIRQSFENRRGFEEYLREPLVMFLLSLSKEDEADHQHVVLSSGERLVKDLSLFVEALPELFAGDVEFWVLVRRALGVQWVAHFNTTRSSEQQQKLASWLQELTQSYVWAVRTAGHHELSAIPII